MNTESESFQLSCTQYLFNRLIMRLRLYAHLKNDADGAKAVLSMTIQEMEKNSFFTIFINREVTRTRIEDYLSLTRSSDRAAQMGKEQDAFKTLVDSIYSFCIEQNLITNTDALLLQVNKQSTMMPITTMDEDVDTQWMWARINMDEFKKDMKIFVVFKKHTPVMSGHFFFNEELAKAFYASMLVHLKKQSEYNWTAIDKAGRNIDDMINTMNSMNPGSIDNILHRLFNI